MIPRPAPRRRPDFSLATVNIVFLLLLFFLSVGTIVDQQEFGIAPPETKDLPLDRLPRPLLLVSESGQLTLDGHDVAQSDLVAAAKRELTVHPQNTAINILSPAEASAGATVAAIGRLGSAGLRVRIVTLRGQP